MDCPSCNSENPDYAKFCFECGTALALRCSGCATELPRDAKFCAECGRRVAGTRPHERPELEPRAYTPSHLAARILAEGDAMQSRGSPDGERKTITALFADLKGSTALIEGLDPEEARAILDPALQIMMDAVHRYDGYVAQALGDGIFALFGAPIAHEDHPQRALYAALHMQEEMRRYSDSSRLQGGIPLQMRAGVNTGEVVVRSIRKDDLRTDYVPVGHSTNLAARMEQIATPGSIVITEYTQRLTKGFFNLKALGAARIKGVEEPLEVYEVTSAGSDRTRLQVSARHGLTRFVGRHGELEQMRRALEHASQGHGQIVGVMGEPGLGKSRLFYEFKRSAPSDALVLEAFSISHGKASPYLPVIELLKSYFRVEPIDDERTRKEKITGRVLTLNRDLEGALPFLFALLGLEDPSSALQEMDAQTRRRRTLEALKNLFLRESLSQPVILMFEDLHWIDGETQGFLDALCESLASASVLLLANYRPEYRHTWGTKTYYSQLRLTPLEHTEAEELLDFLIGCDASLGRLRELILERTEGTPFFMEEVVQALVEEGAIVGAQGHYRLESETPELVISPTVQGVLAARIDRLDPEEKKLLQCLSVIGRQFPLGLVREVVPLPEDERYRLLSALQAKEFLYEQPSFPEVEYIFKHALTQEVAYGSLLQERRVALHERTGQAIEVLYQDSLEDHYGALAHHYTHSGNTPKAVEYLHRAGVQAVQRSADEDAIRYLTTGIDLLQSLPESAANRAMELRLLEALGPALMSNKGYGSAEVERAYARARDLSERLGDFDQQCSVLHGQWTYYLVQADSQSMRRVAEQMLRMAESRSDSSFLTDAHKAVGWTWFQLGKMDAALEHFERGLALYDPDRSTGIRYGDDAGAWIFAEAAWILWMVGFPDQALARARESLARANVVSHPSSSQFALTYTAIVHLWRREATKAKELTDEALALTNEHELPVWEGWGRLPHGRALIDLEEPEAGVTHLRDGWAQFEATGARWSRSYYLGLLAEGYQALGRIDDGLAAIDEAFAFTESTQERFYLPELHRICGSLLLARSSEGEAEASFLRALEIAREQKARSWELRAALSLARLWHSQGRSAEGRDLLAPVYGWFTEGFDTADLKEARVLLEQLAA